MSSKVVIEDGIATVGQFTPPRVRVQSLIVALGLLIIGVLLLAGFRVPSPWQTILGGLTLTIAVIMMLVSAAPQRTFVFDAIAKTVTITRRHVWQSQGSETRLPFLDVLSIGVDRVKVDEGTDRHEAVLRLKNRTITLWAIDDAAGKPYPGRHLDLLALHELTGLRYENQD